MNRERKTRVWDIHKKVFIPTDTYGLITSDFGAFGVMLKDWENYREGEYMYPNAQIQSDWTCLKDKNGNDIYEGDILQRCGVSSFVVWGLDGWRFNSYMTTGMKLYENVDRTRGENFEIAEIIGNIYENPELLNK